MAYIEPKAVVTPKNRVGSVNVIYNGGPGGWSMALLEFDGKEAVGIRWNGSEDTSGIGNPQSRGRPTWFVVPSELDSLVREEAEQLSISQEGGLLEGYRELASDSEAEVEAQEWCEGLIGDANNQER